MQGDVPAGEEPLMSDARTASAFDPSALVVVSNRLPVRAERRHGELTLTRSPGGLVAALDHVL